MGTKNKGIPSLRHFHQMLHVLGRWSQQSTQRTGWGMWYPKSKQAGVSSRSPHYGHRRTLCTGNISTLPAEPLKRAYAMFLPALQSVGVTAAPRAGHVKVAALPLWPKSVRHPLLQLLGRAARCVKLFLLLSLHPCVLWDVLPAQRGMAQHRSWGPCIPCNQSQTAPGSPQTALPGVWRWLQSIPALTSRLPSAATSRRSSPPLPLRVSLSPLL